MIDLRSDTVTQPTPAMREAMMQAKVGDDVFGEDPSVNLLEASLAERFGKEAALFCSSGTQANQIAINVHTSPGDQVICSWAAHIYNYEGGGMAFNSGVTAKLLEGDRGMFTADQLAEAISPEDIHYPIARLVSIEDTVNKGGGATWDLNEIAQIAALSHEEGLDLHLDGARLFNRLVARQDEAKEYAQHFDSISICLSKGLGAPVGSVLLGSRNFITKARRVRKVLGGGMRQAGMLAAAGLYALDHHVDRLQEDHQHAQLIAEALLSNPLVKTILPVETNIIIFKVDPSHTESVLQELKSQDILAFSTANNSIRFVLHLDISAEDVKRIIEVCGRLSIASR